MEIGTVRPLKDHFGQTGEVHFLTPQSLWMPRLHFSSGPWLATQCRGIDQGGGGWSPARPVFGTSSVKISRTVVTPNLPCHEGFMYSFRRSYRPSPWLKKRAFAARFRVHVARSSFACIRTRSLPFVHSGFRVVCSFGLPYRAPFRPHPTTGTPRGPSLPGSPVVYPTSSGFSAQ